MKKYSHKLTKELTPDNWQDKLNPQALSVDDLMALLFDMRKMESLSKKIGGWLKEILKTRTDCEDYDGDYFAVHFVDGYRQGGLDVDALTAEYGEDWIDKWRKEGTPYVTIKLDNKEEQE